MAAIVQNLERTARTVLRRALTLLERSRELATRIAEGIAIVARVAFPAPPAPARHGPVRAAGKASVRPHLSGLGEPLPEGHLVARIAGEEEAYRAPLPLVEEKLPPPTEPAPGPPPLPPAYFDGAFTAMARDPHTLWVYWDFAPEEVRAAMESIEDPRTRLRIHQGAHRVRDLDFALESGSYYVNDLSPGEVYQAEIVVVGRNGERSLRFSNPVRLPNIGPSPWADDRFATLPWDARLPKDLDAFTWPLPFGEGLGSAAWRRGGASDLPYERWRRSEAGSVAWGRPPPDREER